MRPAYVAIVAEVWGFDWLCHVFESDQKVRFDCAFHRQFTLITLQSIAQPRHGSIIGLFNCSI
jgi:hypothetical protein